MKKLIAVIFSLILALGCTAVSEEASTPAALTFATIGEAMNAEGFTGIVNIDEEHFVVVVGLDGIYLRAVADVDEEARRLNETAMGYEDADRLEAATAAFNAYIETLPVIYEEEITAQPLSQEELDMLAGKTLLEVEEAGFEHSGSDAGKNDEVIYTVSYGMYEYDLLLNETYTEYMEHDGNGYIGDLTVKSAVVSGLSLHAAELSYHEDGTYDKENDAWAEYNGIMGMITSALNSDNPEEAIQELIDRMPEHADEIRLLVDVFSAMGGQDGE